MRGEFQCVPPGCAVGRDSPRRATHFSLLRQRKVGKRKATPLPVSPALRSGAACDARSWGGAAELALFAALTPLGQPQRVRARSAVCCAAAPAPRPALLGTARGDLNSTRAIAVLGLGLAPSPTGGRLGWGLGRSATEMWVAPTPTFPQRGRGWYQRSSAAMARLHIPSGCAEERSGRGERVQRSMHPHRDLTRRSCLNGAAKPRSEFCGAPRPRAPQVARSNAAGRSQWGRFFFAYFLLAEQKKVGAPPGAYPGQQRFVITASIRPTERCEQRGSPR